MMTEYIYLFARIALADPQVLLQLTSAAATQFNQKEAYLMEGLLDQWWGKVTDILIISAESHINLGSLTT